jgi:RHS repeat-associated protein
VVRDSRGFSTIFEYNEAEQIVRTVDREGGASTFDYDSEGRLVCTTNQLGGETMIIFDGRGAPAGKVRPDGSAVAVETDAAALVKSIVLPTGAAVKYERDEFGRVVRIARPGRGTVEYTYDARGDVTRFKTPFGKEARLVWSDDRRLFTEADDIGILTQQEVDALGRVVSFEDAVGAVTRFAYDAAGRIAEMRHPDGTQRRFQWDAEGHLTVLIDEANRKTSWAYDSAGRCVEAVVPNGQAVRSTYDTEDRLVSVEEPTGSAHRFAYTPRGLLAHYDTPDGRRIAFRHDPVGNIVEMIDPDGGSTRVRRDPVGRIEHAWYPEGGEKTIALDEGGRWIRIEHGGHVLERELTPDGLVVRERQDDFLLAREFGDAGELRAVTDGSGNRIAYAYDVDGRVRQAQITRGEWAKGQWTATGPPRTHRFDYDRVGSLVRWTLPSGLAEHRRYDLRRRLVEQVVMHGMQAIARRAYEYDATGRCVAIADSIRGRRDFGLDLLGRLERIAENGSERRFIYDASGHEVGGAHYDAQHRLRTAGSWRYEYDSRGFVVRRVHPHGSVEYEWTPQGLLNTARLSDGRSVHFEYDPHQRLVAKRVDGVTTRYFWNEEQLWAIREGNQPVTLFGWLPRAYAPFEGRRGERSWSVHVDHIGKIQEFLDAEGDVHWQAPSGPWGEGRADSGVDCPFGFPGQIWDSATRLYYHRYRFYDPECGRFLTPDPVGIHGGLDPYRYVADPVNLFDPDGLACRGKTDDPTLYRGDSRPPSEICAQGFQPTGPTENISLLDHVGGRSPSNWVSTSYEGADAERAAHWGVTSPKAPPNAEPWVYVIDNPGCGVEVDCDPDIQKRQDDLKKMGVPPEESEHEIAFNGGLPANRVLGYYHADLGPSSFQACP